MDKNFNKVYRKKNYQLWGSDKYSSRGWVIHKDGKFHRNDTELEVRYKVTKAEYLTNRERWQKEITDICTNYGLAIVDRHPLYPEEDYDKTFSLNFMSEGNRTKTPDFAFYFFFGCGDGVSFSINRIHCPEVIK